MAMLLERAGFTVFQAASGRDALEIWKTRADEIDLLFTDLEMPEMNGPELAGELRSLRPDLKVLYTSGSGISVVETMLNSADRGRLLSKPWRTGELVKAVREVLAE
jgi:two-component system cell cycle sensor histidine kinase/response regulator CckA